MKKVLVSGASGIVGYGILRSLKISEKKIQLIGTTIYKDSVAQGFCDVFEQAPLTNSSFYIDWLIKIIKKHKVDFLIPGIEADLYKWHESANEIEKTGAKILLNNKELISLCKDKWIFYESLIKANSPYSIESSLNSSFEYISDNFRLPFLIKPRQGFGSKGIYIIKSKQDFKQYQHIMGSFYMAQPIIGNDDEEYTASAFCSNNGEVLAHLILKRKLSKDGFTEKAEVVQSEKIDAAIIELCQLFRPIGPTNFQFRKEKEMMKLLEINPRISSSTSIRTAFGYNESLMSFNYFVENQNISCPAIRSGKAIRYVEDMIFFDK